MLALPSIRQAFHDTIHAQVSQLLYQRAAGFAEELDERYLEAKRQS